MSSESSQSAESSDERDLSGPEESHDESSESSPAERLESKPRESSPEGSSAVAAGEAPVVSGSPPPAAPRSPTSGPAAASRKVSRGAAAAPTDDDDALPLSAAAAARLLEAELANRRPLGSELEISPAPAIARGDERGVHLSERLILRAAALLALGLCGGLVALAWTIRELGQNLRSARLAAEGSSWSRRSDRMPEEPSQAVAGQLSPFANGKALFADGERRFLVLGPDRQSGVIRIEQVVDVVYDPTRLHGSAERSPHGYYLDDVTEARKQELARLCDSLRKEMQVERKDMLSQRRLLDLSRRIAALHGVEELLPYLQEEAFLARRAAAIALAEQGYLVAFDELIYSFDTGDPEFRAHLAELSEKLTGERFIVDPVPEEQYGAMKAARQWLEEHPLNSPFELGRARQIELERRLQRHVTKG